MKNKRIVFTNEEGGVTIVVPAPDCGLTLEEIAAKDVPSGVAYKIIDAADVPTDRAFRNAWELDPGFVPDGRGADYGAGTDIEVIGMDEKRLTLINRATGKVFKRARNV